MARVRLARVLYAAGLLAMPLSYGARDLFGLSITWVDPTLILALCVFLLIGLPTPDKKALLLVIYAFIGAMLGALLLSPSPDRGKSALYIVLMEPSRLLLNVIWYWISIQFLRSDRKFVLRWLAISVTAQFATATYIYLALYDIFPTSPLIQIFLDIYKQRQVLWLGNTPIYRMAGTFFESPPFSLFMYSCFVVFALALRDRWRNAGNIMWSRLGMILSFLGSVMGLADQVLLALPIFGMGLMFTTEPRKKSALHRIAWACVWIVVVGGAAMFLAQKVSASRSAGEDVYANSVAERSFHTRYGLSILAEQPVSTVVGIGPGRYGDYAVRSGIFPSTVTIQVTAIEWIVEYGVLGVIVICMWLVEVGRRSFRSFGSIGVAAIAGLLFANMFQASWKWESWFFALAFLYSSVESKATLMVSHCAPDEL